MVWPPRVKVRPTAAQRRKRAALKARSVACASSRVMPNDVISGEVGATRVEAVSAAVSVRTTSVPSYACHYCRRTDGAADQRPGGRG